MEVKCAQMSEVIPEKIGILAIDVRKGARLVNESEVPSVRAFWMLALMSWVDDTIGSGLHLGLGHTECVVPLKQPSGGVSWMPI